MTRTSAEFNLRFALLALRRRLPLLLLCLVLVPAVAVAVSLLQKKEYTATASLLFRDPQFDQKLFGSSFVQNQIDPARQAATNLDLVSLPRVAALTAARLHMTEDQVRTAVTQNSEGQSDLVSIQATTRSPRSASQLANTFAAEYIAFRRDADRTTIASAELPLEQQIASLPTSLRNGSLGQSIQARLSQLRVLASLQTGNAELVQPAEAPRHPSSPRPVRNGAFGIFFGALIGIALVLLAEALDRRLRDASEVAQIFERPVLSTLPQSAALTSPDAALLAVPEAEREAFRMLWANLRYFTLSRDIRSVLVTSADRDDGKSTVAWGLAAAAASAGTRILLVEADLRNPTFASRFKVPVPHRVTDAGQPVPRGLTSVLFGDIDLGDAIMRYRFPRSIDDPRGTRSMDVLFAGPRPPDPSDLLQSQRMAEFLREVQAQYDLVVIDTPPAAVVSDAIPLITLVGGVVVVCRLGTTMRDHARRLRQQLDHLEAPVLGIVVNSAGEAQPYAYGYVEGDRALAPAAARRSGNARAHDDGDRSPVVAGEPGSENASARPAPAEAQRPGEWLE